MWVFIKHHKTPGLGMGTIILFDKNNIEQTINEYVEDF